MSTGVLTEFVATEILRRDLVDLGTCLFGLHDFQGARVCFEQMLDRSPSSEPLPRFICDNCMASGFIGPYWICTSCIFRGICGDCFETRSKGILMPNCHANHQYLEIPGKDWKRFRQDEINAEGLILGEWIAHQKQAYWRKREEVLRSGYLISMPADIIFRGNIRIFCCSSVV
jgi:hypothetical protein